jgi:hypothetical protein
MDTPRSFVWRWLLCALFAGSIALTTNPTHAQTITLNNLPDWTSNTRFFSDEYPIKHPSLSLNSFDCNASGGNCDHGLGLKQVLEEVYNDNTFEVREAFVNIVDEANASYKHSPTSHGDIWNNTVRLQARAFVALASYVLDENGENPFNPTTEIRFALPEPTQVRLVVYDVLGRAVATLVDRPMEEGRHRARFDAAGLPSGTYLYRLEAGRFVETRRMTLVK